MMQNQRWNNLSDFIMNLPVESRLCLDQHLKHFEIKRLVLERIASDFSKQPVHYLEFGVFRGNTFRYVQKFFSQGSKFIGFDSFHGLPEPWITHMPNHRQFSEKEYRPTLTQSYNNFDLQGLAPDPGQGQLIQGLFQDTLEGFLSQFQRKYPLVVLIDCDLYSSALYILCRLHDIIQVGDIIIFDEFGDENNEFKAFNDYIHSHYQKNSYVCKYWDSLDGLVAAFEKVM